MLQGGQRVLDIGREVIPEILRDVPSLEVGAVVAEGIAIARTKCAGRVDLGGGAGCGGEAPAGGSSTLVIFGKGRVVVDEVGGTRSRHVDLFVKRGWREAVAVW